MRYRTVTTREAHGQPQLTGEQTTTSKNGVVTSALVGAILGGLAGGLALTALTTFHLPFMASIVGVGGGSSAFGVWMGAALVMGLLFGSIAEPSIDYYASVSTWLTKRSASLRKFADAVPAGRATGVGVLYGLVMGDLVGVIGVPAAVGANIPPGEAPYIIAGYAVFGLFLGFGYEHTRAGTIPTPSASFISPTVRGAIFAPIVAGAISGAIVYAGQPLYLRFLATVPGYGTLNAGFGVWMVVALIFGFMFAAVAYRHAARGNTTTGYGFVYGVVLAVFVGLLAIPAIVSASTQYAFGFESVGGATLLAFVVYGTVLGSLFGKTVNRRPLRPSFLVGRTRATVIASLFAGGVTAAIVYTAAPVAMFLLGFLPGPGGQAAGFATWVGIALLLGAGFAILPARRIEQQEYPGQTGLKLGLAYGLLVALPVGGLIVPRAVDSVITGFSVRPLTQGVVLGSWILFGVLLGIGYGAANGSGRVTPRFLHGREVPLVGGALLGGAAGTLVAYATSVVPGFYLQILGGAIGVSSTTGGVAVVFLIALVAGILFIPFAAHYIEDEPTITRGLGIGAAFGLALLAVVGAYLVPTATVLESPHTKPPVISYFVLGVVFGGVFAVLRRRTLAQEAAPAPTAIGTRGQRAVVFGSLFGGAVGGLVMYHMVAPVTMLYFSSLIGYGSFAIGWAVWLLVALLLGGGFGAAVGPRIQRYVDSYEFTEPADDPTPEYTEREETVDDEFAHPDDEFAHPDDEYTQRDEPYNDLLGTYFERAPITTTSTVAGFGYGIVTAVAVGAIGFPLAVNTMTGPNISLGVPTLQPYFLLAFVVYGTVLGLGYGIVKEF